MTSRHRYISLLTNNHHNSDSERGQSIIIIAVSFIGLLAFIGLAVDFGILLIGMGHLKRGVDAAALAAASQYRDGVTSAALSDSANEFLRLNGVDLQNITTTAQTCDDLPGDPNLCTNPRRKLVRITADADVSFVFLPIIGIYTVQISASSTAEAAAMDVVLVIDISESMTYDYPSGDPKRDPAYCNDTINHPFEPCEPFNDVKESAKSFIDNILNKNCPDEAHCEEEDRIAIIQFSNGWEAGPYATQVIYPGWTSNHQEAIDMLDSMKVYTPPRCDDPDFAGTDYPLTAMPGLCREFNGSTFIRMVCPWANQILDGGFNDNSTCTTTNIGGGLKLAGQMFSQSRRSDALWVTVLLTDGSANSTSLDDNTNFGDDLGLGIAVKGCTSYDTDFCNNTLHLAQVDQTTMQASLPLGYCPGSEAFTSPFCKDNDVTTWHSNSPPNSVTYDADDFARDEALFVGCDPNAPAPGCNGTHGQGALIFTIGLGEQVLTADVNGRPYGETLLRFAANVGDDGDPNSTNDLCSVAPEGTDCGNYYFREYGGQLTEVFNDIFSRIYTRITQ